MSLSLSVPCLKKSLRPSHFLFCLMDQRPKYFCKSQDLNSIGLFSRYIQITKYLLPKPSVSFILLKKIINSKHMRQTTLLALLCENVSSHEEIQNRKAFILRFTFLQIFKIKLLFVTKFSWISQVLIIQICLAAKNVLERNEGQITCLLVFPSLLAWGKC